MTTIRPATYADVDGIQAVRANVRENRLSYSIPRERVEAALGTRGRGWVAENEGGIVGFSFADRDESSIWALFLLPEWEGRGLGRALLDAAVGWLWQQGAPVIRLTTAPGTRAEGFYEHVGWFPTGPDGRGEIGFELRLAAVGAPGQGTGGT